MLVSGLPWASLYVLHQRKLSFYTPGRGKIVPRNVNNYVINYTPGRGKIVPRNITLLVGEKLCRVMLHSW